MRDTFLHYWQGRRRIYMANEIAKSLSPDWDDLTPPRQWARMNNLAVRAYNYYYGIGHALGFVQVKPQKRQMPLPICGRASRCRCSRRCIS